MQDNPPAFPTDGRIQHGTAYDGMSLRDYFAGQALAGLLSHPDAYQNCGTSEDASRSAYQLADAMLAQRSRPDAG